MYQLNEKKYKKKKTILEIEHYAGKHTKVN